MSGWRGSDRRNRLPANWSSLRSKILRRDGHACQWVMELDGRRRKCLREATDVDHIRAGDDHSEGNLRSLCSWHHLRKSSAEGNEARAAKRRQRPEKFVRSEDHPGLL